MLRQEIVTLKKEVVKLPKIEDGKPVLDSEGKPVLEDTEISFGRDEGKSFRFNELSAMALEKWSLKLGFIMSKVEKKELLDKVKETEKEHSSVMAYVPFLLENQDNFIQYIDHFNELLFNYEVMDDVSKTFVRLTPDNIEKYIMEVASIAHLRKKAMEYLNFFAEGGKSSSTKKTVSPSDKP